MDDQNLELDFEDFEHFDDDDEVSEEPDATTFYWALRGALERTPLDPPPGYPQ